MDQDLARVLSSIDQNVKEIKKSCERSIELAERSQRYHFQNNQSNHEILMSRLEHELYLMNSYKPKENCCGQANKENREGNQKDRKRS